MDSRTDDACRLVRSGTFSGEILVLIRILICLLLAGSAIADIKVYGDVRPDSTIIEKNLTVTVTDSASLHFSAWEGKCQLTIGLAPQYILPPIFEGVPRPPVHNIYRKGDGIEWEIILYGPPDDPILRFPFTSKGIDFFYQGELTAEDIERGARRPDSVIGSYAIRHKEMKGNYYWLGGAAFFYTGKVLHQYRVKAWDSTGDTVWYDQHYDTVNGIYSMIPPVGWYYDSKRVYPVTIDPWFGDQNEGASTFDGKSFILFGPGAPASSGTMDSCYGYWDGVASPTDDVKFALYSDDSGPDVPLDSTVTDAIEASPAWLYAATIVDYSVTTSTNYWIASQAGTGIESDFIHYDDGSSGDSYFYSKGTEVWVAWPNPVSASIDTWNYGLYGVYTVGGAAPTPTRRRRLLLGERTQPDSADKAIQAINDMIRPQDSASILAEQLQWEEVTR